MAKKGKTILARSARAFRTDGRARHRVGKESFILEIPPEPEKPVVPMPEPIDASKPGEAAKPPAPSPPFAASELMRRKRQVPCAASAILSAAAISLLATILLSWLFSLPSALSFGIFLALFVPISILLYSAFERTRFHR